ncbi:hypothetical protein MPSI1_002691 [Malassezia psittaci]|uniref:Domain of unknown function at the cortex 1 domain-containing protein n=1 Tax=Malassezia psittaci TaxID=1821823 RepID=A0AAF0JLB9_9BASI|nr:hypothetical protein MPSI1_002691 [Malassezia psittaci]
MAPKLRISAGPDAEHLEIISVNHDNQPFVIDSENFRGRLAVRIKDFVGETPSGETARKTTKYFEEPYGDGMTYSIQVQGQFPKGVTSDQLVFGNAFDRPIRNSLPYGTSLALRFAGMVDPNLKHDLYADKPWAFSPMLATMFRVQANRASEPFEESSAQELFKSKQWPEFPSPETGVEQHFVKEDLSPLFYTKQDGENSLNEDTGIDKTTVEKLHSEDVSVASSARASWMGKKAHREKLDITESDVITVDFCNGFIDFNSLQLVLPYMNLHFDLQKYWDGQPVRYVAKNIETDEVYFVVQFELMELSEEAKSARAEQESSASEESESKADQADAQDEDQAGDDSDSSSNDESDEETTQKSKSKETEISDDVD